MTCIKIIGSLLNIEKNTPQQKKVLKAWELKINTPKSETLNIILQYISLKENYRILDIGAGNKNLETILKRYGYLGDYYSMDVNLQPNLDRLV